MEQQEPSPNNLEEVVVVQLDPVKGKKCKRRKRAINSIYGFKYQGFRSKRQQKTKKRTPSITKLKPKKQHYDNKMESTKISSRRNSQTISQPLSKKSPSFLWKKSNSMKSPSRRASFEPSMMKKLSGSAIKADKSPYKVDLKQFEKISSMILKQRRDSYKESLFSKESIKSIVPYKSSLLRTSSLSVPLIPLSKDQSKHSLYQTRYLQRHYLKQYNDKDVSSPEDDNEEVDEVPKPPTPFSSWSTSPVIPSDLDLSLKEQQQLFQKRHLACQSRAPPAPEQVSSHFIPPTKYGVRLKEKSQDLPWRENTTANLLEKQRLFRIEKRSVDLRKPSLLY
mmetsp:Transcript_822/g.1283  ORF Transcript_822/g.1283 Transcript_822/m.1283 type:complete len:336 (+) Transcript_822:57-1064(+)